MENEDSDRWNLNCVKKSISKCQDPFLWKHGVTTKSRTLIFQFCFFQRVVPNEPLFDPISGALVAANEQGARWLGILFFQPSYVLVINVCRVASPRTPGHAEPRSPFANWQRLPRLIEKNQRGRGSLFRCWCLAAPWGLLQLPKCVQDISCKKKRVSRNVM